MVPPVADQVTVPVAPPVTAVLKVVVVSTERTGLPGKMDATTTNCGATVMLAAVVVPAALVTVSVKILVALMMPLLKAVPLTTVPMPLSTVPTPLLKVGVRVVVPPKATGLVAATRPVATGRPTTVTVVVTDLEASSAEVARMVTD